MTSLFWIPIVLALGGVLVMGVAAAIARRARPRTKRARGKVKAIEAEGEGVWPIVEYVPRGSRPYREAPVIFRGSFGATGQVVGDEVWVFYDPADPTNAEVKSGRAAGWFAMAVAGAGALFFVAAAITLYLGLSDAKRDDTITSFLAAVRAGDDAAARSQTTPDAALDEAFLDDVVAVSTGFEEESSVFVGFDGWSCARVRLLPSNADLVLSLVWVEDAWKIERASVRDERCEARLD